MFAIESNTYRGLERKLSNNIDNETVEYHTYERELAC